MLKFLPAPKQRGSLNQEDYNFTFKFFKLIYMKCTFVQFFLKYTFLGLQLVLKMSFCEKIGFEYNSKIENILIKIIVV